MVGEGRYNTHRPRDQALSPTQAQGEYPTNELLARLGIKSRATLTKYLKYGRRIPDEVVVRMLENLEEEEF